MTNEPVGRTAHDMEMDALTEECRMLVAGGTSREDMLAYLGQERATASGPWPNALNDGSALAMETERYRRIYYTQRPHQALGDQTPRTVYLQQRDATRTGEQSPRAHRPLLSLGPRPAR